VKGAASAVGTPMPAQVSAVVKVGESANTRAVASFASGMRPSPAEDEAHPGMAIADARETTALISSAMSPIGKLATLISDWLRGSHRGR
jgi:hypothetical protein